MTSAPTRPVLRVLREPNRARVSAILTAIFAEKSLRLTSKSFRPAIRQADGARDRVESLWLSPRASAAARPAFKFEEVDND